MAALVGALVVFGAGVAGAAPRATIAITEYSIAAHGGNLGSKPADIAAGPDGNLWFTDQGTTKAIGRATPTGTISEFTISVPGNTSPLPNGIAAGPDGNLWFADRGTKKAIGQITPSGTITEFAITVAGSSPRGVAAGPDGNLWFTDDATVPAIGLVCLTMGPLCSPTDVANHAIHEYGVTANGGFAATPSPKGITSGPDGSLWFADTGTTKAIGWINPSNHAITEYTSDNPGDIAAGPDGNVWFTDRANTAIALICLTTGPHCTSTDVTNHAIQNFNTPTGSTPEGIVTGPDGNVWFTDRGNTAIGIINPTTLDTAEYPIATHGGNSCSKPSAVTAGPDGNLWFADQGNASPTSPASIAVVDLTPPVLTLPDTIVANATGPDGATLSYTATATDTLDPSPVVACVPASGSTFAIGTTTVNCTATDASGNVASGSFLVHVEGAAEQLADLSDSVAGVGPGTSLIDKVTETQADLGTNDLTGTCEALDAFVHEVKAQSGKHIPRATAASLTSDATRIETVLGC
jgi:streptogramin lyase